MTPEEFRALLCKNLKAHLDAHPIVDNEGEAGTEQMLIGFDPSLINRPTDLKAPSSRSPAWYEVGGPGYANRQLAKQELHFRNLAKRDSQHAYRMGRKQEAKDVRLYLFHSPLRWC